MSGRGRKRKYLNAAESAEAKKARDRARQARLVDVGDERQRWSQLAAQAGCTRDCDFAKLLLDRWVKIRMYLLLGTQTNELIDKHTMWHINQDVILADDGAAPNE